MLQINYLRENRQEAIERLLIRNFDAKALIDEALSVDDRRKTLQAESDDLKSQLNTLSKQIGDLFRNGKQNEANQLKAQTTGIKEQIEGLEEAHREAEIKLHDLLVQIPNTPHYSVPKGKSAEDNEIIKSHGEIPNLGESAVPHWELAARYDLIDFELGTKITGAGFPVYKGKGARLQRALINFFLDKATEAGYQEYLPPFFVNEDSAYATGQLPDKEGQMYHLELDNLFVIPTAEVPVTNLFRDVILKSSELPVKCTAYTPCFRREAGSYGKDVRGLNRLHQFDKVEIVQVQHPESSYQALEEMVDYVSGLLQQLGLPYRIAKLCGGDMGFTSALTYDMEVYSAAQKRWLEVSSISNFESFQSNRLKLRFREDKEKPCLVHTLNGSALALPRIMAALLENNQTETGITIPAALVNYTGFELIQN